MIRAYYNDNDPAVAQWLRNLIAAGLLPPGDVDERSIADVQPEDVHGYDQCHWFAGIGGWPYALLLAGWPKDRPVWTGSCPCQPFSQAGRHKGASDSRHLWPEFRRLITECKPATCFGEQVASKDGRRWLSGVRADLEALGYAVGGADMCAASADAPHIRQHLYWVADSPPYGRGQGYSEGRGCISGGHATEERHGPTNNGGSVACGVVHPTSDRAGCADATEQGHNGANDGLSREAGPRGGGLGNPAGTGLERREDESGEHAGKRLSTTSGPWSDFGIVWCDERAFGRGYVARRIEPGTFPLADGVPGRVVKLRAYGNAIVPQVAAEFIRAYMEVG